jgi:hypothetical protein
MPEIIMENVGILVIITFCIITLTIAFNISRVQMYETKIVGENEIRALNFANGVRTNILYKIGTGTGDALYDGLEEHVPLGSSALGISDNYFRIDDLKTGETWTFDGERDKHRKHELFMTVSSNFIKVDDESMILMEAGKGYIMHIYKFGTAGDTAIDVYAEPSCVDSGRINDPYSAYILLGCDELDNIQKTDHDADRIKVEIANVRNRVDVHTVLWLNPADNVTAEDIVISGMHFGDTGKCQEFDGDKQCFRIMRDVVTPARLYVEIDKDVGFFVPTGTQ